MRFQCEPHAALRVLIHGALQVEIFHVSRALTGIVHLVVQLAVSDPIIAGGIRRAILHIEQHGRRGCGDVAGHRIIAVVADAGIRVGIRVGVRLALIVIRR